MKFGVYQVSRRGGREKNEDRIGYCYTRDAGLFVLADGMGGHPEGEVAAQMALVTVASMFQREAQPVLKNPTQFLDDAVQIAHQQLLRYSQEKGLPDTPRTTIVVCAMQRGVAYWAHCGDSRLYMLRNGELMARTRDHSYSELQEALGRHAAQGSERFNRNVLFTCLGSPGKPMVDICGPIPLEAGDRILLCSDGLWSTVADTSIAQCLSARIISDAVPELVEQALRNGGARCDNVTALAVEWEGDEEQEALDSISTEGLDEDSFASTIQARGEAGAELSEAEIENSVREIQEAIRRAGKKQA